MNFIADTMLGKLSKWLRILGFDTLYYPHINSKDLIDIALRDRRFLLTRNTAISKAATFPYLFITSDHLILQMKEVIEKLSISKADLRIFTLCIICNLPLQAIEPEKVKGKVPEYVFLTQKSFSSCPGCQRIFWKGTHYQNTLERIDAFFQNFQKD